MLRIRVHGRGGEGAVTFAHILCASATYDGKFGQSCMSPAIERRGAPVEAYGRIGDKRIAERGAVLNPDIVVVLNPTLVGAPTIEAGMNGQGKLIVNSREKPQFSHEAVCIDATDIAMQTLGRPITNTAMLGAFAAATGLVSTESLEKGLRMILSRFSDEKLAHNVDAIKAGYDAVKKSLA